MSLHGSLDTFALPDVLTLLASTGKTGELHVTGDRTEGRVWVDGGRVVAASAGRASMPVDALFELLRLSEGSFAFSSDTAAAEAGDPQDLAPLLAEAQGRLVEWRGIETVVPSLDAGVALCPEVPGGDVTVRADQWRALVAVSGETRVEGVVDRLGLGEFEACRTLKELVEQGLVAVSSDEVPAASLPKAEPIDRGADVAAEDLVSLPARKPKSGQAREAEVTSKRRPTRAAEKNDVAKKADDDVRVEHELEPEEAQALVRQLASLTGDEEAAARTVEAYEKGELGEGGDDEPINRGLLLKFLSSVRS